MNRSLLLAFVVMGCSSRTELLLGVATDLKAPDVLDRVHLEVKQSDKTTVEIDWDISGSSSEPFNLPGSFGLVSDNGVTDVDLTLTGFKGEQALLTRRAALNLVEDETLFFRMGLTAGCVGRDDCPENWSCVEGVCRDVAVDSKRLPGWDPDLVNELTCSGGVNYINTETGEDMKVAEGANDCPNSRCFEGTCLKPPQDESGTRTVTGSRIVTYVQQNGMRKTVRPDLTALVVSAIVPDGQGGARTIDGVGAADGTFTIPNVPRGFYYLHFERSFFYTDGDALDLGYVDLGRDDGTYPEAVTTINLASVTNMIPWTDGDTLTAYAPDANAWWYYLEQDMDPGIGATSLTGFDFSSMNGGGNLIRNDPFSVIHMATRTSGAGDTYVAATRQFTPAPFTQVEGGLTNLSGAFTDIPQTGMMTLDVRATEWDAAVGFNGVTAPLVGPDSMNYGDPVFVDIASQPGGGAYGFFAPTLDLAYAEIPHGPNKTFANLSFGEPFIGAYDWTRVVHTEALYWVSYTVPGMTDPVYLYCGLHDSRVAPGSTMTITPSLGPVLGPKIAGRDMLASQQGVGLTPHLSWDAPALGVAPYYQIVIFDLAQPQRYLAVLYTADTSLTLPPGILELGKYYAIRVNAYNAGNAASPLRLRYPYAYSMVNSGLIEP